jgi:hypothetical protein
VWSTWESRKGRNQEPVETVVGQILQHLTKIGPTPGSLFYGWMDGWMVAWTCPPKIHMLET